MYILRYIVFSSSMDSGFFTVGFLLGISFCVPITFNNPLKACFSNKILYKY